MRDKPPILWRIANWILGTPYVQCRASGDLFMVLWYSKSRIEMIDLQCCNANCTMSYSSPDKPWTNRFQPIGRFREFPFGLWLKQELKRQLKNKIANKNNR